MRHKYRKTVIVIVLLLVWGVCVIELLQSRLSNSFDSPTIYISVAGIGSGYRGSIRVIIVNPSFRNIKITGIAVKPVSRNIEILSIVPLDPYNCVSTYNGTTPECNSPLVLTPNEKAVISFEIYFNTQSTGVMLRVYVFYTDYSGKIYVSSYDCIIE